jgi:hypothetical protein
MGYIIAYLLFAVVVDLLLEVLDSERHRHTTIAIHRRLWNDSLFDCRSRGYLTDSLMTRRTHRRLGAPLKFT